MVSAKKPSHATVPLRAILAYRCAIKFARCQKNSKKSKKIIKKERSRERAKWRWQRRLCLAFQDSISPNHLVVTITLFCI
jgi:hypothetical protein